MYKIIIFDRGLSLFLGKSLYYFPDFVGSDLLGKFGMWLFEDSYVVVNYLGFRCEGEYF